MTEATALLSNTPAEPAVLFAEEIADLTNEAKHWLDGEPIANEEQATAVSSILNRARRIAKDADELRAAEKKPHDDAGKAVQARWKPITEAADLAAATAKQALAPWLVKLDEEQRAIADAARVEAERIAQIAREAHHSASGNLSAAQDAERLTKAAVAADRDAKRADKAKPLATGGERGVGLVDRYTPELVDACAALKHYRATVPNELKIWLLDQAFQDVRSGARSIPGFTINHERVAR